MNKYSKAIFFGFGLFVFILLSVTEGSSADPQKTVIEYFGAIRSGNTDIIQSFLTGRMMESRKRLLNENKTYSQFLVDFYRGSQIIVLDERERGYGAEVDVKIIYKSGGLSIFTFYLRLDAEGSWKIFDETNR